MNEPIKIRRLRRDKDIDQASMAHTLGISQSCYCNYETGKTQLSQKMKKDILDALGISEETFEKMSDGFAVIIHDQKGGNAGQFLKANNVEEILPLIHEVVEPHKILIRYLEDDKDEWKIEKAAYKVEIQDLKNQIKDLEARLSIRNN